MTSLTYATGRTYNGAQTLVITIEQSIEDEFGLSNITAVFRDASRHIDGRVSTVVFDAADIGPAVLAEYDAGRYSLI